jgi:hypothetical protein
MSEELSPEAKKEAEEFIDALFKNMLATCKYMEMINLRLEMIERRLSNVELALTNDDNGIGKA